MHKQTQGLQTSVYRCFELPLLSMLWLQNVRVDAGGDIVSVASLNVQILANPFDLSHFLHVELELLA